MTALTDRIAAEHDTYLTYLHGGNLRASCEGCDWTFEGDSIDAVMECSRHIATVTEAAVREQVARRMRSEAERRYPGKVSAALVIRAVLYDFAADIARGGAQ